MILVVEGPSAAGKTTWSETHAPGRVVAEAGPVRLPSNSSDADHAAFWNGANCDRWAEALRTEEEHGVAVCDTDPLKLHYDYCLARIGASSWQRFDAGVRAAGQSIAARQLGIADVMVVHVPSDGILAVQRDSDLSRSRRNFDINRQLGAPLADWYETLDGLDPGRVIWEFPTQIPSAVRRERYDEQLFEAWMARLPRDP